MEDSRPFVVFLFVSGTVLYEPDANLDALESALEPRSFVLKSNEAATDAIPSIPLLNPRAVVLVDPNLTENDNLGLWAQLRQYIWNGGTVIIPGWKWTELPDGHSDSLFEHIFFLPWRFGEPITEPLEVVMTPDYSTRRNLKLAYSGRMDVLPVPEYETRGRPMMNVDEKSKVYVTGQGLGECMSCIYFYESGGSIAYIGDTEMNEATIRTYQWLMGVT
jgi:ribonuclease BN (tRNA processing enzyme)